MSKTALVTGSKHGIGYGIAEKFAKKKYNLIMADMDYEGVKKSANALRTKYGIDALAVKCDISNKADVMAMKQAAQKKYGTIDVLVNNAGIYPFKPFKDLTEQDWDKVITVNLKGVYLVTNEILKILNKGGKIVTISSIAGFIGYQGLVHYCASKAGIIGMTRALALELAPMKINVNAVAPGAIETPGTQPIMNEELKKQTIAGIPWGRMGKPEDIAKAVFFLASSEADYITGQTIIVDGGYTLN